MKSKLRKNRSTSWRACGLPLGLALFLFASGCEESNRIEGTWVFSAFPGGKPCQEELSLTAGDFVSNIVCVLKEDKIGQQLRTGHYEDTGNGITVQLDASTCPTDNRQLFRWILVADRQTLQRTIGNETSTFTRGPATTTGIRVLGCFDSKLNDFQESPLRRL